MSKRARQLSVAIVTSFNRLKLADEFDFGGNEQPSVRVEFHAVRPASRRWSGNAAFVDLEPLPTSRRGIVRSPENPWDFERHVICRKAFDGHGQSRKQPRPQDQALFGFHRASRILSLFLRSLLMKKGGFCMRLAEPVVLGAVFPKITPSMTSSERAGLLVQSLLQNGADLRTQPALEEMKRLFTKVMRFRRYETLSHNSPQAI